MIAQTTTIDFQTALLILIAVALVIVVQKLIGLSRRLDTLESKGQSESTTPARLESGATSSVPTSSSASSTGVAKTASTAPHTEVLSTETFAAIAAAIHTVMRRPVRILSIGQATSERQAWSVEGRRQVFHSHQVR